MGVKIEPPAIVPVDIVLRDGRKFNVKKLVQLVTASTVTNLLTGTVYNPAAKREHIPLYSDDEKIWMSQVSPDEVAERYPHINRQYIYVLQSKGRKILKEREQNDRSTCTELEDRR